MATTNTKLNIQFNGEASGVITESERAGKAVKKFGKDSEKATSRGAAGAKKVAKSFANVGVAAAKAAATIAATAGVAFTALVRQGLVAGDALAKTSDKLGVTTDALASMRLAANQTGVATRQFDMALQRVTRRVAEAAAGTGEAQGALKALGLEASELVKLSPDKVLGKIADEFNRIENPAQRVQIAFKLFDAEGVGLVNTLRLGSEGLDDFRQKAETLGLALSREAANNIERANDAVDLLKQGLTGLGQQLAARSAPYLEAIATEAFKTIEAMGGMQVAADKVIAFLVEGFASAANAIHITKIGIAGLKAVFQEVGRAILNIIRLLDVGFVALGNFVIDLGNKIKKAFGEALAELFAELTEFANKVAATDLLPDSLQERARNLAGFTQDLADGFAETAKESKVARLEVSQFLENATARAHQLAEKYKENFLDLLDTPPPGDELRNWFDRVRSQAQEMSEEFVNNLNSIDEETAITTESIADQFGKAAKASLTPWQNFGVELRKVFVETFSRGGDAIGNFIERTKTSLKEAGLRSFFDGTIGKAFAGGAGGVAGVAQGVSGGGGGGIFDSISAAGGFSKFISGGIGGLAGGVTNLYSSVLTQLGTLTSTPVIGSLASTIQSGLIKQFNANTAFGNNLGFTGNTANLVGAGASIVGGVAGSFAGNALGEGIFGKQAESSIGATAGGLIGSVFGPLGSFLGSALGSMIDVAFGGDGKKRNNAGALVGASQRTGGRFGEFITGDSGLTFQSFTRRSDKGVSDEFTNALVSIDSLLTTISRSAGLTVDLSNVSNLGINPDAGRSGAGDFFGAKGFNGAGTLEEQAEAFVTAWLEQIEAQLPLRVAALNKSITGTAEQMVRAFEAGIRIDQLTSLSVFNEVDQLFEVLTDLTEPSQTLHEIYQDLTDQTFAATEAFDGSGEAMSALADSLTQQKTIAFELVSAYRAVSIEIDALLGNTIQNIRESVLSDEQIYAARRAEIASLTDQLSSAISPEEINRLVSEIDSLTNQAYSLLDESQQQELSAEFISFLTEVQDRAQAQIDSALVGIQENDEALNTQIAAAVFDDAVARFGDAVDRFASSGGSSGATTTINVNTPLTQEEIQRYVDEAELGFVSEIGF